MDLKAASETAIAADQAEEEIARQQARSKGLSGHEAQNFLAARWVERVNPFLRALADATRLRIVNLLAERAPMEVGAVANELGIRSSTTSQHLAILRDARIIVTVKERTKTLCAANGPYVAWRLKQVAERLEQGR